MIRIISIRLIVHFICTSLEILNHECVFTMYLVTWILFVHHRIRIKKKFVVIVTIIIENINNYNKQASNKSNTCHIMVELNLRSGMRPGRPFKSGGCARIEKAIDHRGYRLYSI